MDAPGRVAPEVKAAKNSEFRGRVTLKFKSTHLQQVHYCIDLPNQVTFPVHTEQGKMSKG